jgi:hypothetical protein
MLFMLKIGFQNGRPDVVMLSVVIADVTALVSDITSKNYKIYSHDEINL